VIVRMIVGISGSRNDAAWPQPPYGQLEVSAAEGADLIRGGLAVWVSDSDDPPAYVPPQVPVSEPANTGAGPVDTEEEEPEPAPADGPPRPAAPKQDWVDHAVTQGADPDEAAGSTKQQLMETYGQRP
jgi:hypothetical protein